MWNWAVKGLCLLIDWSYFVRWFLLHLHVASKIWIWCVAYWCRTFEGQKMDKIENERYPLPWNQPLTLEPKIQKLKLGKGRMGKNGKIGYNHMFGITSLWLKGAIVWILGLHVITVWRIMLLIIRNMVLVACGTTTSINAKKNYQRRGMRINIKNHSSNQRRKRVIKLVIWSTC